jgi:hypothetical protein
LPVRDQRLASVASAPEDAINVDRRPGVRAGRGPWGSSGEPAGRSRSVPVAARRWCDLSSGDRVLLAAYPDGGLLLVHPPAVLDQVVAHVFEAAWGGDR